MLNNEDLNNNFLQSLTKGYSQYIKEGARSNKKIIPIHYWLSKVISMNLSDKYKVFSLGNGGEKILEGKYYNKSLDITVMKNENIISTISFKFITSNYIQNSNNYFEQLIGETLNIKSLNIVFAHLLVLISNTPYNNIYGTKIKNEKITNNQISKYIKLYLDKNEIYSPDLLSIVIVDIDKHNRCNFTDINKLQLDYDIKKLLQTKLSINYFLNQFIKLTKINANLI